MFADYHVHTEFSDDCTYPMVQVIKDAVTMKMDEICFTDHVDYGIKEDWDSGKSIAYRGTEPLAKEFWTQDFQKGKSQEEYNRRYYEEMLNVIERYQNYSVLGHMDLITRYDKNGISAVTDTVLNNWELT